MRDRFKDTIKRGMAVILTMVMSFSLAACGSSKKTSTITPGSSILPMPSKSVTEAPSNNSNEIKLTGVLTLVNPDEKKMNFVDTDTGTEYEVAYTGGTDIQNKYGKILAASLMKMGDIFDITCNKSGKAVKIYESKNAWERTGVSGLSVDESTRKLASGSNEYQYSDHTVTMAGTDRVSIAQIVAQDEVTLRGVDSTVYSVSVDKGHGFIKFTGIDSFIGGYASVGDNQLFGVTKGMLVTAKEGTYTVDLQKGSLSGAKTVTVEPGKEVTVDFSECTTAAVQTGAVNFSITPQDAVLTVDGQETDYSQPVTMTYGKHKITLAANHYEPYSEIITVDSNYQTKVIDMVSNSSSSSSKSSNKNNNSSSTKDSEETKKETTEGSNKSTSRATDGFTVSVTAPQGAAVYVDSKYIGIVPCSFDKQEGSKTVTLTKEGFNTVSYNISVPDSGGNMTYAFPDLVQKDTSQSK